MSDQIIADKNYFIDDEGKLTTDSTKAAVWLAREGSPISKEDADKYGIGKVAQTEPEEAAETVKKAAKPSANKSETPAENKSAAKADKK